MHERSDNAVQGDPDAEVLHDSGGSCSGADTCEQCEQHTQCLSPERARCADSACQPCAVDDHCAHFSDKPHCALGTCVLCSAKDESACSGSPAPRCDERSHTCVACVEHLDCADARASACDDTTHDCRACSEDAQCRHIPGKPVCLGGECVECAADKREACVSEGHEYVCNPSTHSCDWQREAHSKSLCYKCAGTPDSTSYKNCVARPNCLSDAECEFGAICTDAPTGTGVMTAGAGVNVCLKMYTGPEACGRPFVQVTAEPVTSVDGVSARVCTFRTDTTCRAHANYSNGDCTALGDGDCGEPGLGDGYCVTQPVLGRRCTVPCNQDSADCPAGPAVCDGSNRCSL